MSETTKLQDPEATKRRRKVAYLDEDQILTLLRWCARPVGYLRLQSGTELPPDVDLLNVSFDPSRRALALVLSHPSFDYIEPGGLPPAIETAVLDIEPAT